jgi:hypothetical protein
MAVLAAQRVFLVGAGALGCEFLKNFGMQLRARAPVLHSSRLY